MGRTNELPCTMQECVNWMKLHCVKHEVIQNDNYCCVAIYSHNKRKYSIVPVVFAMSNTVMLINHEKDFDDVWVTAEEFAAAMERNIANGKLVGRL